MNIQALHFVLDINGDGNIAGWEVLAAMKWLFALPGRLVIEALGNIAPVADLLGIHASAASGYASFDSLATTAISLVFWAFLAVSLMRIGSGNNQGSSVSQDKPVEQGSDASSPDNGTHVQDNFWMPR